MRRSSRPDTECGSRRSTERESWAERRSRIRSSPGSWRRSFPGDILTRTSEGSIRRRRSPTSRSPLLRRRKEIPSTRCSLKTGRRRSSRPLHPAALRQDRKKVIQRFPKSGQRKRPPAEADLRAQNTELPCTGSSSSSTTAGSVIPPPFPQGSLTNGERNWPRRGEFPQITRRISPRQGSLPF